MEITIVYWGYIGIMEKKMETTIVYWGYIGIIENEMKTTIVYWVQRLTNFQKEMVAPSKSFSNRRTDAGEFECTAAFASLMQLMN